MNFAKKFMAIKNRSNKTQPQEKHKICHIYDSDAKTATCDALVPSIIFSQLGLILISWIIY